MSFSEKMYRILLRAYPRDYQSRYAEPMQQLFRDGPREVHNRTDLTALWARTLGTGPFPWPRATGSARFSSLGNPAR